MVFFLALSLFTKHYFFKKKERQEFRVIFVKRKEGKHYILSFVFRFRLQINTREAACTQITFQRFSGHTLMKVRLLNRFTVTSPVRQTAHPPTPQLHLLHVLEMVTV